MTIFLDWEIKNDFELYIKPVYQKLYPNVELIVTGNDMQATIDGDDTVNQKMHTELMAGKGPDIVVQQTYNIDAVKLGQSGVLYNIDKLIEKDPEFSLAEYCGIVMDAGIMNNNRLLIPLNYYYLSCTTIAENLDGSQIKLNGFYSAETFLSELEGLKDKYPETPIFISSKIQGNAYFIPYLLSDLLNTNKAASVMESDLFKQYIDLAKYNYELAKANNLFVDDLSKGHLYALENHYSLIIPDMFNNNYSMHNTKADSTPGYFFINNTQGGLTATVGTVAYINSKSPNLENAWNMMKLFLTNYQDPLRYDEVIQPSMLGTTTPAAQMASRGVLRSSDEYTYKYRLENESYTGYLEENRFVQIPVLKAEETDMDIFLSLSNKITVAEIGGKSLDNLLAYYTPYINGEKGFDECLQQAKNYLRIYNDE